MDKSTTESQKEKRASGVAESGQLIRKTSIRRRVSKDDMSENKPYGNKAEEYDKICEKVMADTGVQKTLEALQEKWRMIMYMHDDCMDLRTQKTEQGVIGRRARIKRELIALVITYVIITLPILITLYLAFLFVIWFVTTAS
ncbi:uncharacterized protein [Mytilus edulis]|uniref:uncharacterized protein n=1 Tax=Mytilus edulis TaxID=6550 RepID=UPI0039EEE488